MRKDKEETKEYHREWYKNSQEKRYQQIKAWRLKRREEWNEFKSKLSCQECGENDVACLDFHHLDPKEKDITIAKVSHAWGQDRLDKELIKCVVLCAHCHRKYHAGRLILKTPA